nr:DNA methyltransferase [uncultured Lachnoanaerobaculum sp.]
MEIDARGSEKSLSFCYLKIDNIFCVIRLTREGSGNFLTETYISLRRLENEAIKLYMGDAVALDVGQDLVKVKLNQFYGIEINDFAVSVAKTALWIAESQMLEETKDIVFSNIDFLPLKSYTNIVEGNALEIDWETVVPKGKLSYIIGNPPFIGARLMSKEQKNSLLSVFDGHNGVGNLDFVCGWYINCAKIMKDSSIEAALVSTNSITQGEQASILWKILIEEFDIKINFAYQTFQWTSEAKQKAAVYCVIIGFSNHNNDKKILFDTSNQANKVDNINGYLVDAPNVFIENSTQPISNVNKMVFGSMPNDGGFLSNYSDEEKNNIVQRYPQSEKFFKRIYGAQEFINNKIRWALWLYQTSPSEWRKIPPIAEAVKNVQENRSSSKRESTKKLADIPYLFGENRQPEGAYLLVPRVSSENRRYIPMGFMDADDLASDAVQIVPDATLYDFGILTSNVHMAWMRTVAGRLKSDYRYSAKIVYNNFPWPEVTETQKEKISSTAQAILDARTLYPDSSLADLYDELVVPVELRRAHQLNDKAVMEAYGLIKEVDGKKLGLQKVRQ